jgi:hypothetical protein
MNHAFDHMIVACSITTDRILATESAKAAEAVPA